MIRLCGVFLVAILLAPPLAQATTARCPGYGVSLRGSTRMRGGVIYWVRMDLRRVKAGGPSKYDGQWQVTQIGRAHV